MSQHLVLLHALALAALLGAARGGAKMNMVLHTAAFANGAAIPQKYTGDGTNVSPPLAWEQVPEGTQEFALICDDPDAPRREPWVHWVLYKIGPQTRSLKEGVPPKPRPAEPPGALQGLNSWTSGQRVGYRGPQPPAGHGTHHYHFKLYALDAALKLGPEATKEALVKAMAGHILAEAEAVGTYER